MKSIINRPFKKLRQFFLILLVPFLILACASDEAEDDISSSTPYNGHASWGLKLQSDATGDIYITGTAFGDITSDSDQGTADIFLAKYNAAGNRIWLRQIGSEEVDYVQDIRVSASGAIYLAGYTSGVMEDDATHDGSDIFVMKYNAAGVRQWVRQLGTDAADHCWAITSDESDNLYLAGDTSGVFSGTVSNNDQGSDMVIIKLDSSGTQQWVRQLGSDRKISVNAYADSFGAAISLDSSGDIIVGGTTNDSVGGDRFGYYDIVLAKYNPSGNQIWIKQIGTEYDDYIKEIETATSGNIYFTGYSYGTVDASYDYEDYSENHNYTELFVFKLNTSGEQQWIMQYGTSGYDRGNTLVLDNSENIYLAGNTNGDLADDNVGSYDYFLMKIDSSGSIGWSLQNGSNSYDTVEGITRVGSNLYITGRTYDEMDDLSNDDATFTAFISRFTTAGSRAWTRLF